MLKNLFFILLTTLFTFQSSWAQDDYYFDHTEQGTLLLNAGTNFGFTRDGDSEITILNLSSDIGYFFVSKFCLGASVSLSITDTDLGNTTFWTAGPFARAYIGNSFFGAGLLITGFTGIDNQFALKAEAGYPVFLSSHIAFEPTLEYLYSLEDEGGSTFGINFGFSFYFAGRPDY